jgi:crotonobetainyl-CoA:carnitine CoA-transferase CaiB-like acyl-CoA transferase
MNAIKNLKVVELASVLAGPSVGMFFAELGAEVIKIENLLTQGDVTRFWKLSSEKEDAVSAYFCSINWGKKHLFKDYNNPTDLAEIKQLIAEADIVLCNFKKGGATKFGLDYPTLSAQNPQLIYAQLNGFAENENRVAFDVVVQAETGYMYMNGQSENPPTKMPLAFMDILAGHQLKEGVLVALLNRTLTNKGAFVETSLEESGIASLANQASNYLMANHIPQRIGSLHPNIAPYGEVFTTLEKEYIVLAVGSDVQFTKLCLVLRAPHLAQDKRFLTNADRVKNRMELYHLLDIQISMYPTDDIINDCIANQIPAGKIKNLKEVFESNTAKNMILEEIVNGQLTKRVKSVAFKVS